MTFPIQPFEREEFVHCTGNSSKLLDLQPQMSSRKHSKMIFGTALWIGKVPMPKIAAEPMSYAYRLEGISTYDCLELNPPQIGYNGCSRGNERPQLLRAQLQLPRLTRRCEMWRSTGYASGWSCN